MYTIYHWHIEWCHCSRTFFVLMCDMWHVTFCDVTLTHNPKLKINRNRKENEKVKFTIFNSDKESSLVLTEIEFSSDYESEGETSTSSVLFLYTFSPSTLLLLSLSTKFLPLYNIISQLNPIQIEQIIQQYQEQMATIQVQS